MDVVQLSEQRQRNIKCAYAYQILHDERFDRLLSLSCRVGDLSLSFSCRVGEYFFVCQVLSVS